MDCMSAVACHLCKKSAGNVLCMDCVAKDVRKFLPRRLGRGFQQFHHAFAAHFDSSQLILNGAVYCMGCRSTKESPVCPPCYTGEVYGWLAERDLSLAERFRRVFSFSVAGAPGEDEPPAEEGAGICDECGEYADDLMIIDGEWVCRDCLADQ